ncbi:MAG TPA: molybdopterin dinucleotide-binding protein [Gammaproteobacteria bacterium]|nr:molybdopterin dinucleotide-binding protein [Gammaproteobacteria bacterium]
MSETMSGKMNRRSFLKVMGWSTAGATLAGCDLPSTVTLEEGKEDVVSYLMPEEYVIPGVGVWYASTCTQCAAACGIHGRVREGRVLKLEGNPDASLNHGKLCMMGQAGVQGHYNPDRITSPLMRSGGNLTPVSWDKALALLEEKLGAVNGERFAWFTGTISGHQAALVDNHLEAMGSSTHYVHEVVNNAVSRAVYQDMLGESNPRLRLDKAKMIVSFGADFMGASVSPVHYAGQYAKFRTNKERGLLVQVEPKMSLTGGSADLWLAIKPGTEAVLALGMANLLLNKIKVSDAGIPADVRSLIDSHDITKVARITGVAGHRIQRVTQLLTERSPSLVLPGANAEGQAQGYDTVAAIMMLNHILGNVGKTIESSGEFPFPQLMARQGGTADLLAFAEAAKSQKLDAVIFHGSNPLFTAPASLGLSEAMASIGFKVAIAQFPDETSMAADLVLPVNSYLEDWGTQVPANQGEDAAIHVQQPLMEKLHADTRGFGDILLTLLKQRKNDEYAQFEDYYAYLRNAFAAMPAGVKNNAKNNNEFWNTALQTGVIKVASGARQLSSKVVSFAAPAEGGAGLTLIPSPRLGLFDGRHANLPWLQEAPDQISKVVWDSWAEMHPATAAKLGINDRDLIKVSSAQGNITLRVTLLKGMNADAIAVPLGNGHTDYGRYAKDLGVNPLQILDAIKEKKTGELAMYGTQVTVKKVGPADDVSLVRMGASDTQAGRKLVATIPVEQLRRTEGS